MASLSLMVSLADGVSLAGVVLGEAGEPCRGFEETVPEGGVEPDGERPAAGADVLAAERKVSEYGTSPPIRS